MTLFFICFNAMNINLFIVCRSVQSCSSPEVNRVQQNDYKIQSQCSHILK